MATTYSWIHLGMVGLALDPTEGNADAENASNTAFRTQTFGSASDPLINRVTQVTAVETANPSGATVGSLETNNTLSNDTLTTTINGTSQTLIYDAITVYNATITYTDGTTNSTITAVIVQTTDGNLFLAPEMTANADTTAFELKPIRSITLNSVNDSTALNYAADRYVTDYKNGYVDGTAGNDSIGAAYLEQDGMGGERVDNNDAGLPGTSGNMDWIKAGAGNDTVAAGAGNDTVEGGTGNDSISGGDANDDLRGEDGDDTISGDLGTDSITGGIGNDSLLGGGGNDTVIGGDGADTIDGGTENDVLNGGAGNDSVLGSAGNDTLTGDDGNDTLDGGADADSIRGGIGNDSLVGATGNDTLMGDGGDDTVIGGDGNDVISGDSGALVTNHIVNGDFAAGSANWSGTDLETGNSESAYISGGSSNLVAEMDGAAGTTATVMEQSFAVGGAGTGFLTLRSVVRTAGTIGQDGFRADILDAGGNVVGTMNVLPTSNTVWQTFTLDFTFPAAGTYTLRLTELNPTVTTTLGAIVDDVQVTSTIPASGNGNDSLSGGAGLDTIDGGAGNDSLDGGTENDSLTGGDGNDTLAGGAGADTLGGGIGMDYLDYTGSDAGVAINLATSTASGGHATGDVLQNGNDGILGSAYADTLFGYDGESTLPGDPYTNIFYGNGGNDWMSGGAGADGLYGGNDNDTLYGDAGADTLDGGTGLDVIYGGLDADTIYGGGGADTLAGDEGNDSISGDDGNDQITGGIGADTLLGGNGNDTIAGGDDADSIEGGAGHDSLNGDAGNDTIFGGAGRDTVNGGTGDDFINTRTDPGTGVPDTGFTDPSNPALNYPADADPTGDRDLVDGGDGNDTILTGDDNDTVLGGTGNDWIDAGFDADSVSGGAGNDTLDGGEGRDTIDGGDDADLIYGELGPTNTDYTGYLPYEQDDATDPDPLNNRDNLSGGAGNDTIYGQDDADTLAGGTGNDLLDGGVDADSLSGDAGADTLLGGTGNDTLSGGDDADSLDGGDGADLVAGDAGADTLTGGAGADTLQGGADADVIYGATGDVVAGGETTTSGLDNDTLYVVGVAAIHWDVNNGENGTVEFTDGSTLSFTGIENLYVDGVLRPAPNYIVEGDNNANEITGIYTGDPQGDMVDAGDNQTGTDGDLIYAYGGNDAVASGNGDDTVEAGTGNDTVFGGAGNDSLIGDLGADELNGDAGNDTLSGGDGFDTLSGGADADSLTGGLGNDSLSGGTGNDTLDGGGDSDTLSGGDGNDLLSGGNAADTLSGGAGADTIYGGDDADLIIIDAGALGGSVVDGGDGGSDNDVMDLRAWGKANTNIIFTDPYHEDGTVEFLDAGGAVIGTLSFADIETIIPCFTPGTKIVTDKGKVAVERLEVGDRVLTRDNGYQILRWVGRRDLEARDMLARPDFQPVLIRKGALGAGVPTRDMIVSPQHRMLICGPRAEVLFGEHEVLVAAVHLLDLPGVERLTLGEISYIHLLCDHHEIIRADGAWTESFQPGDLSLGGMEDEMRDEILDLFPELAQGKAYPAARMTLKRHEAQVLMAA